MFLTLQLNYFICIFSATETTDKGFQSTFVNSTTPCLNRCSVENTPTVPYIDLATMQTYHISSDESCKLILKFL